jgi:long-chain fatty acid transport protein
MTPHALGRTLFLTVVVTLLTLAGSASAGGFYVARFGGEHGNPTTGNPTAIHYNPAGLALESGYRVYLDGSLAWLTRAYDRPPDTLSNPNASVAEIAANSGRNELSNLIAAPFIGFATDFGSGLPFGVGLAFYVPFGGSSVWDEVEPVPGFPGSSDGSQRWYNIEGTIRSLTLSLGGAYRFERIGLSVGLGANLYLSEMNTIRARNADGTDDLTDALGNIKEGRSLADVSSTDIGLGIGVIWEAIEDVLWIGASYQSQPNFGRDMEHTGTLDNALAISAPSVNDLSVSHELPDIFRLGFRYRPMTNLELRLDGNFQRWSVFEQQCLVNTSISSDLDAVCSFASDGSHTQPGTPAANAVIQNLSRGWNDTWGVRIGGSFWVTPQVELIVGVSYDSNAVPDSAQEPALPDFDKIIPAIGAQIDFTDWFRAQLTVLNVFYLERDTSDVATAERFEVPSRQPSSAGVYESNALVINLGLGFTFGGSRQDAARSEPALMEPPRDTRRDPVDEALGEDSGEAM